VTLLVGIMPTHWSILVEFYVVAGSMLAIAGVSILGLVKEVNMMKTVADAIILTVGTALLGRPIQRRVSNFSGVRTS